jgi:hypothetical protein
MASTGLLGFNPYGGGFQFDPSSKIVNLAVQLEQKEQAKKGALEKYFMDYEKSVNPAGLSKGESDIFLKKYNDNKQFWMKNKEAILNPSKYGYDAQSQYMANLKDQMGYINEAKQANEQRKAFNSFIAKAKAEGKDISDNVLDITSNAAKPVGAGYIAPDLAQVQVFKPHDPISYLNDLKKVNRIETEPELKREGAYDVFTSKKIPDLNEAIQVANGKLKNDKGYEKYILNLAQDPQQLIGLGKIYQQRIGKQFNPQSIEDVSLAYTLSGLPIEKSKPTYRTNLEAQSSAIASRQKTYSPYGTSVDGNILDNIGSEPIVLQSGSKIEKGVVTDKNNNPYNGQVYLEKNKIPADLYAALGSYGFNKDELDVNDGFTAIVKDGRIQALKGENLPYIDRTTVENAQLALNKEPKGGRQMGFGGTPKSEKPSAPKTLKEEKKESNKMVTVSIEGKEGIIPENQWESFKKKYPKAIKK